MKQFEAEINLTEKGNRGSSVTQIVSQSRDETSTLVDSQLMFPELFRRHNYNISEKH